MQCRVNFTGFLVKEFQIKAQKLRGLFTEGTILRDSNRVPASNSLHLKCIHMLCPFASFGHRRSLHPFDSPVYQ